MTMITYHRFTSLDAATPDKSLLLIIPSIWRQWFHVVASIFQWQQEQIPFRSILRQNSPIWLAFVYTSEAAESLFATIQGMSQKLMIRFSEEGAEFGCFRSFPTLKQFLYLISTGNWFGRPCWQSAWRFAVLWIQVLAAYMANKRERFCDCKKSCRSFQNSPVIVHLAHWRWEQRLPYSIIWVHLWM